MYWQAVAFVKDQFSKIRETDVSSEYNKEIVNLREQLFRTKDELQSIKNSRVLGRLIKIRNRAGATLNRSKGVSGIPLYVGKRAFNKTRKVIAPLFPENTRNSIKKTYRTVVQRGTVGFEKHVRFTDIPNPTFDDNVPLVSVVIPYYNRADTIDETIRSLKDQSYKNFDVVIINDGSTDAVSIKKLKKLNFDFLKAKVINQDNKGVAAARNTGIAQASGKYIICLDSDDILVPTFIEKAVIILETRPDVSVVSSHMNIFGVINEVHKNNPYDPLALMTDNMVITAAAFRKAAWSETTGYKAGIGYEDWEFWITLSQLGHWGTVIPEALFTYRTSLQSRYVEDKDIHWNNLKTIRSLHPKYKKQIRRLLSERLGEKIRVVPETGFINIANPSSYNVKDNTKINVLITMPWMTFGGAETLVYNYCREITETCNISFVTGLQSEHEWEYKFKYVSPHIYHLINLFEDDRLRLEFVSNYIKTRQIQVLHIVHNGFMFSMLPELKDRHPTLKVIVTLFNDRVPEYVSGSVKYQRYIDQYVSDNSRVETSLRSKLDKNVNVTVIPNGVNAYDEFNPAKFDREKERTNLKLSKEQISIFYIGRFSEEKNPDIFVQVARHFAELHNKKVTFFMIGDGPMRPEIEQMIQANNNSAQVIDLGYQVDVARYLSAADILVLPSSVEGFPLSILEAMAMEAAVIASDVGAVSDVVENGKDGFVVSPGSVLEIAQVIEALASDQKKLYSIKKNGRKKVENKYSNRVLSHNYKQLYKRLIQ